MRCLNCGKDNPEGALYCGKCGSALKETSRGSASASDYSKKLGWHKFLINFSLFVGALINLFNGVLYLTGDVYGDDKLRVYMIYTGLKGLDFFYGIILLAIAAYTVYVRFQLAGFKISAPKKLTVLYALDFALTPLYMIFAERLTGLSLMNEENIGSLIGTLIIAVISVVYYNKRKALFVN